MIWCVEDDDSIRDIEVYALQSTGLEARGFADGGSFWAALEQEKPALVVLDVMLPGVSGIDLLRRMKASPALREIPVVMATAKGAEYDRIQGLDLGADYYLTKPFGVMELVSCVKAVLRRCRPDKAAQGNIQAVRRVHGEHDALRLRNVKQLRRRFSAGKHRVGRAHGGAVAAAAGTRHRAHGHGRRAHYRRRLEQTRSRRVQIDHTVTSW